MFQKSLRGRGWNQRVEGGKRRVVWGRNRRQANKRTCVKILPKGVSLELKLLNFFKIYIQEGQILWWRLNPMFPRQYHPYYLNYVANPVFINDQDSWSLLPLKEREKVLCSVMRMWGRCKWLDGIKETKSNSYLEITWVISETYISQSYGCSGPNLKELSVTPFSSASVLTLSH